MGQTHFLLQGHAVTLTFKVATQMLRVTHCLNMVIISVKELWAGHDFAARSCCDLDFPFQGIDPNVVCNM